MASGTGIRPTSNGCSDTLMAYLGWGVRMLSGLLYLVGTIVLLATGYGTPIYPLIYPASGLTSLKANGTDTIVAEGLASSGVNATCVSLLFPVALGNYTCVDPEDIGTEGRMVWPVQDFWLYITRRDTNFRNFVDEPPFSYEAFHTFLGLRGLLIAIILFVSLHYLIVGVVGLIASYNTTFAMKQMVWDWSLWNGMLLSPKVTLWIRHYRHDPYRTLCNAVIAVPLETVLIGRVIGITDIVSLSYLGGIGFAYAMIIGFAEFSIGAATLSAMNDKYEIGKEFKNTVDQFYVTGVNNAVLTFGANLVAIYTGVFLLARTYASNSLLDVSLLGTGWETSTGDAFKALMWFYIWFRFGIQPLALFALYSWNYFVGNKNNGSSSSDWFFMRNVTSSGGMTTFLFHLYNTLQLTLDSIIYLSIFLFVVPVLNTTP